MTYRTSRRPRPSFAAASRAARLALLAGLAGLTVSGCQTTATDKNVVLSADAYAARPEVQQAIAGLNAGDAEGARGLLGKALRKEPANFVARKLLDQIDKDPAVLLGAENFPYAAQEGDTLTKLAETHLGDPLLFYALARYNNIAVPSAPLTGRLLRIPGKAPEPPKQAEPAPKSAPRKPPPKAKKTAPAPVAATPAKKPAAPAPAPAANPAQAAKLRAAGLAALNGGKIDRAVTLLRQAQAADPGNAVIRNDLARALRIQASLRR